jgi:hypothetical protein
LTKACVNRNKVEDFALGGFQEVWKKYGMTCHCNEGAFAVLQGSLERKQRFDELAVVKRCGTAKLEKQV